MENIYKNTKILDCTIRDGGYLNNWDFSIEQVRDCYKSASEAGFDYFEIGFRSSSKDFSIEKFGKWIFSNEEDIIEAISGINGCKIAVMSKVDNKNINITHFIPKHESVISMVRVLLPYIDGALDMTLLLRAKTLCEQLLELGYEVTANLACIDSYKDNELIKVCNELQQLDIKYIYFADTYGAANEEIIEQRINLVKNCLKHTNIEIGFHAHNNLCDAYCRSIKAIKYGASIIDSCMYGMGRGAGNLQSEILIGHFYKNTLTPFVPSKYHIVPILRHINKYIRNYTDKYNTGYNWGYNILYVLTGFASMHPTYATEFIDLDKNINIDTIYDIYECLLKANKHLNYDKTFITIYLDNIK